MLTALQNWIWHREMACTVFAMRACNKSHVGALDLNTFHRIICLPVREVFYSGLCVAAVLVL